MIEVNDTVSIKSYQNGWELHVRYTGKDKEGAPKEHVRVSYHPSIRLLCLAAIDACAGECQSLSEIVATLDSVSAEFRGLVVVK